MIMIRVVSVLSDMMIMICLFLIVVIIFSSVTYHFENGYTNTTFTSIPAACWWGIITMTHVGYGDMVPQNFFGKVVGSLAALVEIFVLGLMIPPIQQVGQSHNNDNNNK